LSWKTTPVGRPPLSPSVGNGKPRVVTRNVPAEPTAKVALAALVKPGASLTVRVKDWTAAGGTPLAALRLSG
jgi:hypothetical protein